MPGPFTLAEIAGRLGGEVIGDGGTLIHRVGSLRGAQPGEIAFLNQSRYRDELAATRASAVIVPPAERETTTLPRIVCADPYLYFARVSALFHPQPQAAPGIHPSAVVHPAAQVAASAQVAAGAVIDAGARIGDGAIIGPRTWVGEGASIGAGSRLVADVNVYPGCAVGERCLLHAGVVLGSDGFGFAPDRGTWVKIPQIGRVLVGDDVEIGANTTIDRGALDDTVIENGVKLDNQIQIGHNCRIGAHTAIAGCAGIAGSVTIGRHCMIGGAAMIGGHLSIADRVVVAGGTWVTKSITEPGLYLSVIPATPDREWRRTVALVRGLERMSARLKALEGRLAQLESDK